MTSTASQLKVIRDAYYTEYRISLERDLNIKVEGLFGQMLKDLLLRNKDPDSSAVDLDYVDGLVDYLLRVSEALEILFQKNFRVKMESMNSEEIWSSSNVSSSIRA